MDDELEVVLEVHGLLLCRHCGHGADTLEQLLEHVHEQRAGVGLLAECHR